MGHMVIERAHASRNEHTPLSDWSVAALSDFMDGVTPLVHLNVRPVFNTPDASSLIPEGKVRPIPTKVEHNLSPVFSLYRLYPFMLSRL